MKTIEQIKIIREKYGRDCDESYKKIILRFGDDFCEMVINFDRMLKLTDKIIQVDNMCKNKYLLAFSEALLYEINLYTDNFADLRKTVLKGGYELNKPSIDRMLQVGVKVPEDIISPCK